MATAREKIIKLLALAQSPNENEAKAAMLKARKLMAEHKLSSTDLAKDPKTEIVHYATGITFSKRRNMWLPSLAETIATNYCCRSYHKRRKGYQTRYLFVLGFEEDVAVCLQALRYAISYIEHWQARARRWQRARYSAAQLKTILDGYAYGFVSGLRAAFSEQEEENAQWGLVLAVPSEVNAIMDTISKANLKHGASLDSASYHAGYDAGLKFDAARRQISTTKQ